MAEFKITRFRYTWTGPWDDNSVAYKKDDVVYYQGSAWVCVRAHTSGVFDDAQTYTAPGDTFPTPAWVEMSDGREWNGDWTATTRYDPNAIVLAGGNLYLCIASHVASSNFSTDILKWDLLATGNNFRNTWTTSTRYRVGDIIRYNGYTYQCTTEHTAGSVINESDWDVVVENYSYVGSWSQGIGYRKNDLVRYGGSILKCTQDHTSSTGIDNLKFETYLPAYNFQNDWNSTTYYAVGDVVKKGGSYYIAQTNNQGTEPGLTEASPGGNTTNWTIIDKAVSWEGDYDPQSGRKYRQGDLVKRGGTLWISLIDQLSDNSTLETFDNSNWEIVISSYNITGAWQTGKEYNLYDIVYFRGVLYYANTPHTSGFENFPGDNGEGIDYWTVVVISNENSALTNLGDLITYNLYRNVLQDGSTLYQLGDGSTFGPTAVPIGEEDQLLVVEDNNGSIGYKVWGTLPRIFYVRTNGVDDDTDPNRGVNYFKPWKTIRYALEHADDDYEGTTTVLVSTGEYQEILPLIVPARTAVVGDELRGVTVRANDPIDALANDAFYTLTTLVRLGVILPNLLKGLPVDASSSNNVLVNQTLSVSITEATIVDNIWASIIGVIDYIVNGNGSYPTVTGSNTSTTDTGRLQTISIIESNREFLKEEAIAFMTDNYLGYSFNTDKCRRDLDKFIDGLVYDVRYTGNYKSVLAGRYYANAVAGSALEDMFYVRDSTGLRNMTLKGLEGTLPALQPGDVYRIPTGGAFVSLDPGWGPNDERVWITNRSCYIQNVTTFGTGAVGQKIDGTLHAGGNRSIVSNDFTQVISDGIGAWVKDGGRAELVSVFTYYCHIGMFATDGGIIRATNGNSSYGDFGAVADGLDAAEVVRYGYVNTRTEQAQVAAAFAGEILDFILALEFTNMGQEYSTATYSITSSGAGATTIQEEFRDDAMFSCDVLSAGSGFTQYGNQAQYGTPLTITLATAETADEADILGMRIIIISGDGTGQYGYVQAYNSLTKVCTVYRESDDLPGWDHVLPGTPTKDLLTTGTRYRIEPRPIFEAPPYSALEVNTIGNFTFANGTYSETTETFTNVQGTSGTGTTIDITPAPATFTVVKTGRSYSVTLTSAGAGYAVGDTVVIDGANVGGDSIENDITITITDVTDDSTNSIVDYSFVGTAIGSSGKFVLTPLGSDTGVYSFDGDLWEHFTLPAVANWTVLASGMNMFVTIANGSNGAAYSYNGIDWSYTTIPIVRDWRGLVYGKPLGVSQGIFVAVAGNLNSGAYSTNGISWNTTTLPTVGDSTICEWTDIAYGNGLFVALANEQNIVAVGTWNGTTLTWTGAVMDVIADSSRKQWVSIAYGNRRFVAISDTGDVAYSFDGLVWYAATMPKSDGSTIHKWQRIRYGQGVFFAVGNTGGATVAGDPTSGPTTFAATSYDGIVWTQRELATPLNWSIAVFGNPDVTLGDSTVSNSKPTWILASSDNGNQLNKVYTGARALGRIVVSGSGVASMKLWESGSGYLYPPEVQNVVCPGATVQPTFRTRIADGVLAQPTFISKGSSYKTSTTYVTVSGDGFADITPNGKYLTLDSLTKVPGPGAQFYIAGRSDYFIAVANIEQVDEPNGTFLIKFQISPNVTLAHYLEHGMEVVIREKYSQVRITGHDFLDVGAGNFENTNYPLLYQDYNYTTVPLQEVYILNGGRVFYTSTDQDGNFRAGDLFAVEQATGIITISADFFDLAGLTELRLAGINVGSTAIIREFSKDPLFLQNSNSVIPTQRAVRSYLQSKLNIGGEDLLTPSIIAGTVKVGPAEISNTAGLTITVTNVADFSGPSSLNVGISGSMLAQTMFFRSMKPAT